MAYIALLEEKLRPALVTPSFLCCFTTYSPPWALIYLWWCFYAPQLHTFWVDAENYANLTRPWFASRSPFPLNFVVPSRLANAALSRILLTKGEAPLHRISEVEGKVNIALSYLSLTCSVGSFVICGAKLWMSLCLPQIYSDAKECLNLLSYRLGTANYFFGNSWVFQWSFKYLYLTFKWKAIGTLQGRNGNEKSFSLLL